MSQQQEENEAIAHRFHMDIFQGCKLEVADEIIASDFVWRNPIIPSESQHGPESVKVPCIDRLPLNYLAVGTTLLAGLIHVILASKELSFNFLNEGTFFTIAGAAQMFWVLPMPVCLVVEFHKSI
jgi:hypothetical protein